MDPNVEALASEGKRAAGQLVVPAQQGLTVSLRLTFLDAVLSVLPLEKKDPQSCWRMIANGSPENDVPIFAEFQKIIAKPEGCYRLRGKAPIGECHREERSGSI
jgi:L-fucose mutarotase/ribose pyranase (RbsD/FucU family)